MNIFSKIIQKIFGIKPSLEISKNEEEVLKEEIKIESVASDALECSEREKVEDTTLNESIFGTHIDRSKELADPKRYFSLFDKHIPRYENSGEGKNIALVDISNIEVEEMMVLLNPLATFHLFDNFEDYEQLKILCPDANIILHDTNGKSIIELLDELPQ